MNIYFRLFFRKVVLLIFFVTYRPHERLSLASLQFLLCLPIKKTKQTPTKTLHKKLLFVSKVSNSGVRTCWTAPGSTAMLLISFYGWSVSKSICVSHCAHADGAVSFLQLNCGFLPFPWCGKWDPMLVGLLENSGNSTMELSVILCLLQIPSRAQKSFSFVRVGKAVQEQLCGLCCPAMLSLWPVRCLPGVQLNACPRYW